mmetsp:Transcript_27656/g.50217  ORF Transcript_27656/g.50217 Transcript_27656/m.50217 type:complete len:135 (+) Transcript_27656:215-619(+)
MLLLVLKFMMLPSLFDASFREGLMLLIRLRPNSSLFPYTSRAGFFFIKVYQRVTKEFARLGMWRSLRIQKIERGYSIIIIRTERRVKNDEIVFIPANATGIPLDRYISAFRDPREVTAKAEIKVGVKYMRSALN